MILAEMVHDARIVPLADKERIDDDIRLRTGDSCGCFGGDTLVAARNFTNPAPSFSRFGNAGNDRDRSG